MPSIIDRISISDQQSSANKHLLAKLSALFAPWRNLFPHNHFQIAINKDGQGKYAIKDINLNAGQKTGWLILGLITFPFTLIFGLLFQMLAYAVERPLLKLAHLANDTTSSEHSNDGKQDNSQSKILPTRSSSLTNETPAPDNSSVFSEIDSAHSESISSQAKPDKPISHQLDDTQQESIKSETIEYAQPTLVADENESDALSYESVDDEQKFNLHLNALSNAIQNFCQSPTAVSEAILAMIDFMDGVDNKNPEWEKKCGQVISEDQSDETRLEVQYSCQLIHFERSIDQTMNAENLTTNQKAISLINLCETKINPTLQLAMDDSFSEDYEHAALTSVYYKALRDVERCALEALSALTQSEHTPFLVKGPLSPKLSPESIQQRELTISNAQKEFQKYSFAYIASWMIDPNLKKFDDLNLLACKKEWIEAITSTHEISEEAAASLIETDPVYTQVDEFLSANRQMLNMVQSDAQLLAQDMGNIALKDKIKGSLCELVSALHAHEIKYYGSSFLDGDKLLCDLIEVYIAEDRAVLLSDAEENLEVSQTANASEIDDDAVSEDNVYSAELAYFNGFPHLQAQSQKTEDSDNQETSPFLDIDSIDSDCEPYAPTEDQSASMSHNSDAESETSEQYFESQRQMLKKRAAQITETLEKENSRSDSLSPIDSQDATLLFGSDASESPDITKVEFKPISKPPSPTRL